MGTLKPYLLFKKLCTFCTLRRQRCKNFGHKPSCLAQGLAPFLSCSCLCPTSHLVAFPLAYFLFSTLASAQYKDIILLQILSRGTHFVGDSDDNSSTTALTTLTTHLYPWCDGYAVLRSTCTNDGYKLTGLRQKMIGDTRSRREIIMYLRPLQGLLFTVTDEDIFCASSNHLDLLRRVSSVFQNFISK